MHTAVWVWQHVLAGHATADIVTTDEEAGILEDWQTLFGKATRADQMQLFNQRSELGVIRSKAFKTTFQKAPLGSYDELDVALQQAIDTFVQTCIFDLLVTHAGKLCPLASASNIQCSPVH